MATKRRTAAPTVATRTLMAETKSGSLRKIIIPANWTISFGPIAVGVARNGQESPNVLRIYADAGRKDLQAVYRDIVSVSDERVQITERKTVKRQKTFTKKGSNGEQVYAAELRKTVWSDPFADEPSAEESDDFDENVLKLPPTLE